MSRSLLILIAELLTNSTSKQTNGTGTISASVSHNKKPVSICTNKRGLFLRPDQNKKLGIRFAYETIISLRNGNLLSFKFKETAFFHFFKLIIRRVPFGRHTKKGVFGTVRTESYGRYMQSVLVLFYPAYHCTIAAGRNSIPSTRHVYWIFFSILFIISAFLFLSPS